MGNNQSNINYIYQQENKQHINNTILNANESLIQLNKAEQIDNYINKCTNSWSNRIARLNNKYEPYELKKEKEDDYNYIINLLPKWLPISTSIIILNKTAENGMPHTRPDSICLPSGCISYSDEFKSTIFHESIHIHQRKLSQVWQLVYEKAWKMKKFKGELPEELNKYRRYNPDTIMDGLYVWNDKWVVVPIYLRKDRPVLNGIRLNFYNVITGETVAYIPEDWIEFFGRDIGISEQEHPNEMAAYSLQKYFFDKTKTQTETDKLLYVYVKEYFPEILND
jgi:hypothetical protein